MIEKVILQNLVFNEEYTRRVISHIDSKYFVTNDLCIVFKLIELHFRRYGKLPTKESLLIDIDKVTTLKQQDYIGAVEAINSFEKKDENIDWLVTETERFVQEKALHNAALEAITIMDGKSDKPKTAIPTLFSEALSVSFDRHIGHDYIGDWEHRYDYYHTEKKRIPFDIEILNTITRGGLIPKTLNAVLAATGVGKSAFMCHCAAFNLASNYNTLYITLEMSEEEISARIDANLFNIAVDEVEMLPKDVFQKKVERIKQKTTGKLIVKEYPTTSAGASNFRHLLNELRIKQSFVPDIIYIDYLNICASSRLKMGAGVNSYSYVKAIAEELRGLAVEFNVPIFTATQTNREGYDTSDISITSTSDSMGGPMTLDLFFALASIEELAKLNQIYGKQLKNRYAGLWKHNKFLLGVDLAKMKFFDVEQESGDNVATQEDKPLFDDTKSGERIASEFFKDLR